MVGSQIQGNGQFRISIFSSGKDVHPQISQIDRFGGNEDRFDSSLLICEICAICGRVSLNYAKATLLIAETTPRPGR